MCAPRVMRHTSIHIQVVATRVLTRVWQQLEYRIDVCRITHGAHIEHL